MMQRLLPLLGLLLLLLPGTPAPGQTLVLGTIDVAGFPVLEAPLVAFDAAGSPLPLSNNDSVIVDEGGLTVAAGRLITCPPTTPPRSASIALVLDHSGSMSLPAGTSGSRLDVMKAGVRAFLRTLDLSGGTTVGVTMFDDVPLVLHPRSANRSSLEAAVASLALGGGTQFTPAFLDPFTGGIPLLGSGPSPRHLVFITDGEPFQPPDVPAIIAAAQAAGITVHVVTIATRLTDELKSVADGTGGTSIGDIVTGEALVGYLASLAGTIQEVPPCRVVWTAPLPCGDRLPSRLVAITVIGTGTARSVYTPPQRPYPTLRLDTLALWFGPVAPGGNSTRQVTLTAEGAPFRVSGITPQLPQDFSVADWGGTPPPFTLQPGQSRTVTLRFIPSDSGVQAFQVRFASSPCLSGALLLSGGVPGKRVIAGLRLVEPVGGELYSACDPLTIVWRGVPPERPIRIEGSKDGGNTWFRIADSARGLRYTWTPAAPGGTWRVRIAVPNLGPDSIFLAAGGGIGGDNGPATQAQLGGPTNARIVGSQIYLVESGRHRVRRVELLNGLIQTIAGTGSPGYSGDGGPAFNARLTSPNDIAIDDTVLYIADAANNIVRAVDLNTGIISKIAGTGEQGFSGDGGLALDAQLNLPAFLALAPGALYVTDRTNARVRRIDLRTRRISTVAGGGVQPEGDGGPALNVRLVDPAGIAWDNGTLYVVERGRHRVRSVGSDGGVATIAGSGVAGYTGDGGAPLDARFNSPTGIDARDSVLLLADEANNVIRRINLHTGKVSTAAATGVPGFIGDNGPALAARLDRPYGVGFAPWGYAIADFGNDWVRMVVSSLNGVADSSASFSVARARLTVTLPNRTFTFDTSAIDVTGSAVLNAALCNHGDLPSIPDTVQVIGPDAEAFRISSGLTRTPLLPGECITLELLFTPKRTGPHSAALVFNGSCSDPDTLWLNGTGRSPCGVEMIDRVEIGAAVGSAADTTVTAIICNTGTESVSGTVTVESPDNSFTGSAGTGSIVIPPGGCHTVALRFTPGQLGTYVGRVRFESDNGCGVGSTLLLGTGRAGGTVYAPATITLAPLLCPGEGGVVRVPLINGGAEQVQVTGLAILPAGSPFTLTSTPPPIAVPGGDSTVVTLLYRPQTPGNDSIVLRATVARANGDTIITVTVRGSLERIDVAAEPSLLHYPARATQQSDSVVLLINRSTVPVTLDSASLVPTAGSGFALINPPRGLALQPGETLALTVRSLDTVAEQTVDALLLVATSPSCGNSPLRVVLAQTPQRPALTASPLDFTLPCGADSLDTVITLFNRGSDTLRIGGGTLGPPPLTGTIDVVAGTIAPGDSGTLRLRALLPRTGDLGGVLTLVDPSGVERATLPVAFHRSAPSLRIEPAELVWRDLWLPVSGRDTLRLTNTGAAPLELFIASAAPTAAEIDNGQRFRLVPGETREVHVTIMPEALRGIGGSTTLTVRDLLCDEEWSVAVRGEFEKRHAATFQIPHSTAPAGTPVRIPVTVADRNTAILDTLKELRVRVEIAWDGTTMRLDSIIGAIAPASYFYNSSTGTLSVIFDATLDSRDTIATIAATTLIGGTAFSDIRFDSIEVLHASLAIGRIDGSMTLTGDCRTLPPKLGTRPHLVKVAPNPATNSVTVTLDLEGDETVEISLVRIDGTVIDEMTRPTLLFAGRHNIPVQLSSIPGGQYLLRVTTLGGEAAAPLIIQR